MKIGEHEISSCVDVYTLEINYRLTMFRRKKGIIQVHVITFQTERKMMCEMNENEKEITSISSKDEWCAMQRRDEWEVRLTS